jgi:hypothetical protein
MAKHRKHTRKSRKTHKRRGSRRQRGGAFDIEPEVVGWKAANFSLPQGVQFAGMHVDQHGGAAPVGYTGVLPADMQASARTDATMVQYGQIAGLRDPDQTGGRRRRHRKGRKASRKSHKSRKAGRKSRKARKSRKQRGGALAPAPVSWVEAVSVPSGVNPQFKSWDASA